MMVAKKKAAALAGAGGSGIQRERSDCSALATEINAQHELMPVVNESARRGAA